MAARVQLDPGIHLGYFEPTVDQYLKKIQQAVTTQDLSAAQQAFARLEKKMSTSAQPATGTGSQPSAQLLGDLGNIGAALGSGDLALAGQALNDLRNSFFSARGGQSGGASADQTSSPGETDTPLEGELGDAVRTVDLKA